MLTIITFILYIPVFIIKFALGIVATVVWGLLCTIVSGPDKIRNLSEAYGHGFSTAMVYSAILTNKRLCSATIQ